MHICDLALLSIEMASRLLANVYAGRHGLCVVRVQGTRCMCSSRKERVRPKDLAGKSWWCDALLSVRMGLTHLLGERAVGV